MTPRILIIAGSDSGGGAGIQADIKTVTMLGGHAMTAITALTAQNTLGVQAVLPVPTDMVLAQINSVVTDIGVDAVKIGMIGSTATAHAVADLLPGIKAPAVFDPVMVATSGGELADAETIGAFRRLLTVATLVTPNLPELEALGGIDAVLGDAPAVLIKGGHGEGETIFDHLVTREGETAQWSAPRIASTSTHGTGCTLASAITVGLAQGLGLADAIAHARLFVRLAIKDAPGLGGGHGPMGQQNVRLDLPGEAKINQISVPMTDFEASVAFYRALGLHRIVKAAPRYARFESDGGVTFSIEAAEELPTGGPMINFECADLEGTMARLRAAGVTVSDPVDQPYGWREVHCVDPGGTAICLYQAGEIRRFPPWRDDA
jgi:hydroxymethylpyrimidine/phosphomethylpyrimidine kinase